MSRPVILVALLPVTWASAGAHAQEAETVVSDRFYAERAAEGDESQVRGSIASSTYVAPELGDTTPVNGVALENASPVVRIFTELRGQLAVTNIAGNLDLRTDARLRFVPPCSFATQRNVGLNNADDIDCRFQSGTYGTNEYELRELYVTHSGASMSLQAGRQYVAEVAATKIDGVKVDYPLDENWSLIGFGGLYPSRISRSVATDYDNGVLPAVLGAGSAYRFQRFFGSIGAAGVVPLTQSQGQVRSLVTSNGYWRPSQLVDVYHYLSVDLTGQSTEEIADRFTNVSVGLNIKPTDDLRVTTALHHFSTDALEEYALQRLEQPDNNTGVIQNNIEVLRLAAQSARLGVSLAMMEKRFEISTSFALRHRPPQRICPASDPSCATNMGQTSADAWSGEAMLRLLDRRSVGGLRLGASLINMFGLYDSLGLGVESYGRSNYLVARLDGSRELMDGQMQIDVDVSYLHAEDIGDSSCMNGIGTPLTCYGKSVVDTVSGGGTLFYRFAPDWFALVTANVAMQTFAPGALSNANATAYANTLLTGFLRLAYRF